MLNPKTYLFAMLTVVTVAGIGACGVATSRSSNDSTSTTVGDSSTKVAKEPDGMNHGEMKHGSMTHNMDIGPANANYDLRFLDSMIPHHQGALVMSKEVLTKSKRPELIKLAKSIISEQQKEIAQMQQWRKQWYPKAAATPVMWHSEMNHEMAMTAEYKAMMQMNVSLGNADAGFDKRFLDAMIPHHQGAVTMAKDALQKSQRPELQKYAKGIGTSQQQEIDTMTQWRSKWYPQKPKV
jgi:uncharacterized protein (DUF305 family)